MITDGMVINKGDIQSVDIVDEAEGPNYNHPQYAEIDLVGIDSLDGNLIRSLAFMRPCSP